MDTLTLTCATSPSVVGPKSSVRSFVATQEENASGSSLFWLFGSVRPQPREPPMIAKYAFANGLPNIFLVK